MLLRAEEVSVKKLEKSAQVAIRPTRFAQMLDLADSTVYGLIKDKTIPAFRVGRSLRIPISVIDKMMEQESD
jgi:excisionase family DNA binding protein